MCCFEYWKRMSGCTAAVHVLSIVCCAFGVLLLIMGIAGVTRADKSTGDGVRSSNIDTYNRAVQTYAAGDMLLWRRASGSFGGSPLTVASAPVPVGGNSESVTASSHYYFQSTGVPRTASGVYQLTVGIAAAGTQSAWNSSLTMTIPSTSSINVILNCNAGAGCSSSAMATQCTNTYGGTYTSTIGNSVCSKGQTCGTCAYIGQLTDACVVIVFGPGANTVTRSTQFMSCAYPFTAAYSYGSGGLGLFSLMIMSEQDPFLTLQSLTTGSSDFGAPPSNSSNNARGAVIIILIGLALIFGMVVCIGCMVHRHSKEDESSAQAPAQQRPPAPQGAYPVQMTEQSQQPPVYGQPVYGHHASAYAVPEDRYGATPLGEQPYPQSQGAYGGQPQQQPAPYPYAQQQPAPATASAAAYGNQPPGSGYTQPAPAPAQTYKSV